MAKPRKKQLRRRNIKAETPRAAPGQFDAVIAYLEWYRKLPVEIQLALDTPAAQRARRIVYGA